MAESWEYREVIAIRENMRITPYLAGIFIFKILSDWINRESDNKIIAKKPV